MQVGSSHRISGVQTLVVNVVWTEPPTLQPRTPKSMPQPCFDLNPVSVVDCPWSTASHHELQMWLVMIFCFIVAGLAGCLFCTIGCVFVCVPQSNSSPEIAIAQGIAVGPPPPPPPPALVAGHLPGVPDTDLVKT